MTIEEFQEFLHDWLDRYAIAQAKFAHHEELLTMYIDSANEVIASAVATSDAIKALAKEYQEFMRRANEFASGGRDGL